MKRLKIILWGRCPLDCAECDSLESKIHTLGTNEVLEALSEYYEQGAREVVFSGGEPTVREDLPTLGAAARELGYELVGVETNGLRFSNEEYAKECRDAGISDFCVSFLGWPREEHDTLAGREGAYNMAEAGLAALLESNAWVTADILVTRRSVNSVDGLVKRLALDVGVNQFSFRLFSIFCSVTDIPELLPVMSEAADRIVRSMSDLGRKVKSASVSHIMPCLLGERSDMYAIPSKDDVVFMIPHHTFSESDTLPAQGVHVEECGYCRMKKVCPGPRPEYIKHFGDSEFKALR